MIENIDNKVVVYLSQNHINTRSNLYQMPVVSKENKFILHVVLLSLRKVFSRDEELPEF